jgi:hypothetical protein
MLLNKDGASIGYWLAMVLTTIPENSGNMQSVTKLVQEWKVLAAVVLKFFSVGNIVICAHVIPEIKTSCKTGDTWNE